MKSTVVADIYKCVEIIFIPYFFQSSVLKPAR